MKGFSVFLVFSIILAHNQHVLAQWSSPREFSQYYTPNSPNISGRNLWMGIQHAYPMYNGRRIPSRIYRGTDAPTAVNERTVKLECIFPNGRSRMCTGSIVALNMVLTAAHCFDPLGGANIESVLVTYFVGTTSRTTYGLEALVYNRYTPTSPNGFDFALMEADANFDTQKMFTLSQNSAKYFIQGNSLPIAGWGQTTANIRPTKLQETELPYEATTCPNSETSNGAFCTVPNAGVSLTCDGDSGGPVFVNDGGYILLGSHVGQDGNPGCPGTNVRFQFHVDISKYYSILNGCLVNFACNDFNKIDLDLPFARRMYMPVSATQLFY